MEDFIVSARKYRPVTFNSVVGQKTITTTLKNAIKNNHLAHAYLFTGPRGVGKTTCARIFAKTLNCLNRSPEVEACNECESCKSFNSSRSYSIHELDAASNNSVEDIRSLIEQVRIPPQIGQYSIYIIDEVHMLSASAFNAFLKTLEEPPAHAIFILATTEKHKILATILSRCQIFDFNRITVEDSVQHLQYVAQSENIAVEEEALNIIAQKADGAMRDALSLFDQIVSFSGTNITYKDAIDNLNVLDYEYYFRLVDAFLRNNLSDILLIFNTILTKGFDGHHFITGLSTHFRDLLVCKDEATVELLEVGNKIKVRYIEQSKLCEVRFLLEAMKFSNTCDLNYKSSRNKRLQVELALMQMSRITLQETEPILPVPATAGNVQKTIPVPPTAPVANLPTESPEIAKTASSAIQNAGQSLRNAMTNSAITINDAMNGKIQTHNTAQTPTQKPPEIVEEPAFVSENPFGELELVEAWKAYTASLSGNMRDKTVFGSITPKLKENYVIEAAINNQIEKETIEKRLSEALHFFKTRLKNKNIKIEIVVNKQAAAKKIYTASDKYQYLNTKNPQLSLLKQKFNLDIEK